MPSPEAVKSLKPKHIRTLQRRLNFLLAMEAEELDNGWDRAEMAALKVAVVELSTLLDASPDRARAQETR